MAVYTTADTILTQRTANCMKKEMGFTYPEKHLQTVGVKIGASWFRPFTAQLNERARRLEGQDTRWKEGDRWGGGGARRGGGGGGGGGRRSPWLRNLLCVRDDPLKVQPLLRLCLRLSVPHICLCSLRVPCVRACGRGHVYGSLWKADTHTSAGELVARLIEMLINQ